MSRPAILVESLAKCYWLGARGAAGTRRWLRRSGARDEDALWALRDVSFSVQPGEVIGIVGTNGSGKTTLLKVLSRVTAPTRGALTIRGRISSLLEVGTGFHPDLTGRENIFLNTAILGMSRAETRRHFDQIVDFAGVERFLDTPLKHYSSGMQIRLGFAVAAQLSPEIIIIDEVFSVGDAAFQSKSLARVTELARSGRTALFVSHNLAIVEGLCTRAILLSAGQLRDDGTPNAVIRKYWSQLEREQVSGDLSLLPRAAPLRPILQAVRFLDAAGKAVRVIAVGEPLIVEVCYASPAPMPDPYFGVCFQNEIGTNVVFVQTRMQRGRVADEARAGTVRCTIPALPLLPGRYWVQLGCGSVSSQLDLLPRAAFIDVVARDVFGTGILPPGNLAQVVVDASWTIEEAGSS